MFATPYTLVNLAGSYDLGHGVTLFARINNLLDRHYQDPIGFQHQGLGVFGGIKVAFDVPATRPGICGGHAMTRGTMQARARFCGILARIVMQRHCRQDDP